MRTILVLALAAGCIPSIGDVEEPDLEDDLERAFKAYSLVTLPEDASDTVLATGRLELPLDTGELELVLVPHDLRGAGHQTFVTDGGGARLVDSAPSTTFKGTVGGDPATPVRLSARATGITATFVLADQRFFVEPARKYSDDAAAGMVVVYQASDARASDALDVDPAPEQLARIMNALPSAPLGERVIELATDADYALVTARGGAAQANAEILQILNIVEGVYEHELGITFDVVLQHAWTVGDAYREASPDDLLASFGLTWEGQFPRATFPRDLALLFSGRDVIAAAGRTTRDVVCDIPSASYAVAGDVAHVPARALLTAHEIALAIGANQRELGGCESTIMNATLSYATPLTFCATSRAEIAAAIATHGACLVAEPDDDPIDDPMPVATPGTLYDFSGDGHADLAVFRPSNATWYLLTHEGYTGIPWGLPGDALAAADYDGDGRTDLAIVRDAAWWRLRSATQDHDVVTWGFPTDIPVPADYDRDGRADIAIFRPENGQWWVLHSSDGNHHAVTWGLAEDIPIAGDFTGDGRADYTVYRPSTGVWYVLEGETAVVTTYTWGLPGDIPLAADFDGDGRLDPAVFRPSNNSWNIIKSSDGALWLSEFGAAGDVPVPADYDGNGRADFATFRPATNEWHVRDEAYSISMFGLSGDVPIPAQAQTF